MPAITIRTATLNDLPATAALFDAYRQFYEQAPDLERASRFIHARLSQQDSTILLAFDQNQQAAGFCQLYPSFCSVLAEPIAVLYDLFVAPTHRLQGLGKALLLAARAHAEKTGQRRMDLTTAKTNAKAQALYESLGWVRDDVFYAYNLGLSGQSSGD